LIVWCKACRHQVEPDPAEMAARYDAETPVPDWRELLVCSKCGSREIDTVVTRRSRIILALNSRGCATFVLGCGGAG
jgi:hypothetical protein